MISLMVPSGAEAMKSAASAMSPSSRVAMTSQRFPKKKLKSRLRSTANLTCKP